MGSFLSGESKCNAEKLNKRRFAASLGSNDENAMDLLELHTDYIYGTTHLKGVGSFLLLTRRGLLTALAKLLA